MEGSNEVFSTGVVHAGFAANRGIHHGQQGGWNLNHTDAPQPCGRGESRHVSDHPASESQHQRAAFQLPRERRVMDFRNGCGGFLVFSGFDQQELSIESMAT